MLASMIYFDSDMSKSTNTVVYFDWTSCLLDGEGEKGLSGYKLKACHWTIVTAVEFHTS
jgi:hypothetical protein